MDVYDLDTQQLPRLYRVQYDESQTTYEIGTGLKAQDTDTFYDAWYDMFVDFGGAVEQHLNWDHNYTSIFISLFSEKRHAENWLLDRHSKRDCGNCTLLEIDATQLGHVYEAQELVESLSLIVPEKAKASISKEYLVAHHITPRAIIRRITLDEIKQVSMLPFNAFPDHVSN